MPTTVSLLFGFCVLIAVISIARFVRADERDPVDAGTNVLVLAITVLAGLWMVVEYSALTGQLRLLLGVVGVALAGIGIALIARYWRV